MEPTNETISLHLQQADGTTKPLHGSTTKNHTEPTFSQPCKAKIRVCPYCGSSIPASEDPCHICGHLEPALYPDQAVAGGEDSRAVHGYVVFMALVYLVFGIVMIIAPDANPSPDYYCEPFDADDCFFPFIIWSRPGGIISVGISLLILIKALGWQFPWRQR